jgi:hypothetical protein
VKLVAYIDESGTHDVTGQLKGAREAEICGYVAPPEEWVGFCKAWKRVLNNYAAPYFHFCEWTDAYATAKQNKQPSERFKTSNPYAHLSLDKLNQFILELGKIAGGGNKYIVGTMVATRKFHQEKQEGKFDANANPYHECAGRFFRTSPGKSNGWFLSGSV